MAPIQIDDWRPHMRRMLGPLLAQRLSESNSRGSEELLMTSDLKLAVAFAIWRLAGFEYRTITLQRLAVEAHRHMDHGVAAKPDTIRRHLEHLIADGLVERDGNRHWRIRLDNGSRGLWNSIDRASENGNLDAPIDGSRILRFHNALLGTNNLDTLQQGVSNARFSPLYPLSLSMKQEPKPSNPSMSEEPKPSNPEEHQLLVGSTGPVVKIAAGSAADSPEGKSVAAASAARGVGKIPGNGAVVKTQCSPLPGTDGNAEKLASVRKQICAHIKRLRGFYPQLPEPNKRSDRSWLEFLSKLKRDGHTLDDYLDWLEEWKQITPSTKMNTLFGSNAVNFKEFLQFKSKVWSNHDEPVRRLLDAYYQRWPSFRRAHLSPRLEPTIRDKLNEGISEKVLLNRIRDYSGTDLKPWIVLDTRRNTGTSWNRQGPLKSNTDGPFDDPLGRDDFSS